MSKMDKKEIKLKNFVYADWNVILSLYSQFHEGISEYKMSEKRRGRKAGLEAKGGLPWLKGGGNVEQSRADIETEKVIRHHDLYNRLESDLLQYSLATVVTPDFDFDKWTEFDDSDYLLVRPQLIRYANYRDMMSLFQTSIPLVRKMQRNAKRTELERELLEMKTKHSDATKQNRVKEAINKLDAETDEDLTEEGMNIVAEFLGIRFKVMPNKNHTDKYFVCNCDTSLFTGSLDFLKNQFGLSVEGPWVVFGQVNVPTFDTTDFAAPDNQMDGIFDKFFTSTQEQLSIFSGVQPPAISLTPICIYRETTEVIHRPEP